MNSELMLALVEIELEVVEDEIRMRKQRNSIPLYIRFQGG